MEKAMSETIRTIPVKTSRPYDILVGRGLLEKAGEYSREVNKGSRALLVSDANVASLYADRAKRAYEKAGYTVSLFTFPAGEEHKRLSVIAEIYGALAAGGFTRSDLLVALGGGVTGDMTGFAAATWLRGTPFVQIPTSLLAQVDSSVGGKTGVDIPEGKNLVGAFWQPVRVIADPDVLSTLSPSLLAEGMAEIIKAAAIKDSGFFAMLEQEEALSEEHLVDTITQSIIIKRDVVERDENESGERKLLNFGHTMGHALEKFYDYSTLSHGYAVALGMVLMTEASERQGLTEKGTTARITAVLQKYGLPIADTSSLDDILPGVALDKKRTGSHIDLALLHTIGDSFIYRLPLTLLGAFLRGEEV